MTREREKPPPYQGDTGEARAEVAYAASFVEWFAEEAPRVAGEVKSNVAQDRRLLTVRQPVGVLAVLSFWLCTRCDPGRVRNLHVRGYKEEGSTTTPFDMTVRNDLDRYHLVGDVVDRVPAMAHAAGYLKQFVRDKLIEHAQYIVEHGEDLPEVREWRWPGDAPAPAQPEIGA